MVKIIGNKNQFAIEYRPVTPGRGFCRIWIKGKPFGNFTDEVYLLALYDSLMRVKQFSKESKLIKLLIGNKGIFEIKDKLFFDDEYAENALIGLPENFDDFIDRIIGFNGNVYICWVLIENPYFAYESEYDKEPHIGIVKESEYLNVLDNYQRDINSCIGA